jgi:predicted DNA-binding protein
MKYIKRFESIDDIEHIEEYIEDVLRELEDNDFFAQIYENGDKKFIQIILEKRHYLWKDIKLTIEHCISYLKINGYEIEFVGGFLDGSDYKEVDISYFYQRGFSHIQNRMFFHFTKKNISESIKLDSSTLKPPRPNLTDKIKSDVEKINGNVSLSDIRMYCGDMSDDEIAEVFDILKLYSIEYGESMGKWYATSELRIKIKTPLNGQFSAWTRGKNGISEENIRVGDVYIKMRETFVNRMRDMHNYYLSSYVIFKIPNGDYNYKKISPDSDNWSYSDINSVAGFPGEIIYLRGSKVVIL